jgi:hypothetical protein
MPRGENAISTCPIQTATSSRFHGRSYDAESTTRVRDAFPVWDWESGAARQLAIDKSLVDDRFGSDVCQFTSVPRLNLLSHGSKFLCIRSTPTEMQSIRENDFECFASTGVNTSWNNVAN